MLLHKKKQLKAKDYFNDIYNVQIRESAILFDRKVSQAAAMLPCRNCPTQIFNNPNLEHISSICLP